MCVGRRSDLKEKERVTISDSKALSCFTESAQNKGVHFRDTTPGGRKRLLSHGRATRPKQHNEERIREEDWTVAA
jgi:hypothetical protein